MPVKLSDPLKDAGADDTVASSVRKYEHHYGVEERGGLDERNSDYKNFINIYYDLVTDFYEYGWGQSFHFAPRAPNESFLASIARHEHYLAHMLDLWLGMQVIDLDCGIGGPLREIVRFSGAKILGVSNNAYRLKRARKLTEDAGLVRLADYLRICFTPRSKRI